MSSVTFVYYRELNSGSFILVWWVGWVAGLMEIITNSARAEAKANVFQVYSLSSVTFVYYRELNSSSFILVRWVGGWLD